MVFENKHKRKSAIITVVILMAILYYILNFGMHYLDPPEEYGVAINFGNYEIGSGEPTEIIPQKETSKVIEKEEVVKQEAIEIPSKKTEEDIIKDKTSKNVPIEENKIEEKKPEKKVIVKEVAVKKPTPKPSQETTNALQSLLNGNASDGKPKGEEDDKKLGVKGNKEGVVNASTYYGNAGSGSDGDYNLSGRKALLKPIKQPNCEEQGIVVVRIQVDKNGKVTEALAGVKGTTNSAPCLLKPAQEAALKTLWNADVNAPTKQIGTIIYKFSLSK